MSAYMLDDAHIDALIDIAKQYEREYRGIGRSQLYWHFGNRAKVAHCATRQRARLGVSCSPRMRDRSAIATAKLRIPPPSPTFTAQRSASIRRARR